MQASPCSFSSTPELIAMTQEELRQAEGVARRGQSTETVRIFVAIWQFNPFWMLFRWHEPERKNTLSIEGGGADGHGR